MSSQQLWAEWVVRPQTILLPDERDAELGYNYFMAMPVHRHAGAWFGMLAPFLWNNLYASEIAGSRDGWDFQRLPKREHFIEFGADGAWDHSMVVATPRWVEVGDEWWFYYAAFDGAHDDPKGRTGAIGLATIRKEGFISQHAPKTGGVDCTLGYGGHASALLKAVQPGGTLLALDQDPIEIVRTEVRLRAGDCEESALVVKRMNFAGLPRALGELGWSDGADVLLADLGCSSMQFDNPARGFSFKHNGPLDMRMNPQRGVSARELLHKLSAEKLTAILNDNADEPHAKLIASALAETDHATTRSLAEAVRQSLPHRVNEEDREATVRRVFQALRIAVNEEFTVLETFLHQLPACLRPGARVAILTFHSGEDRRVKHLFREGLRSGLFSATNDEVIRPSSQEMRDNPRAAPAKLRWAVKG